jgi:hypothetical protein
MRKLESLNLDLRSKFFAPDQIREKRIIHKIQQSESLRNEQSDDDLFRFTISIALCDKKSMNVGKKRAALK